MTYFKKYIINFLKKLGISSSRSQHISLHIGQSFFYKAGTILINFLLVPITLDLLDSTNYGVWLTLSSFILWFQFFDAGLGNGLRNKLAESLLTSNYEKARAYVSTAYFIIGFISISIMLVFIFISQYIEWTTFFNTDMTLQNELKILLPIVFSFFMLQLVLKLIINIYQAYENHSITDKFQFIVQCLYLLTVWFLTKMSFDSLLLFGAIYSSMPVLVLIFFNFLGFKKQFKKLKPSLNSFSKENLKDITTLGLSFFITKIGALVLLSTDTYIISKIYSPAEVVPYSLAYKYFSIIIILYAIIVQPYWTSFTRAFGENNFKWIKESVKSIQRLWLLVPTFLFFMIIFSGNFFEIWVGDKVIIPLNISLSIVLFVILYTYSQMYNQFINGVGKVRLHVYISLFIIIFNIPLSIFLAKYMNLHIPGIVLGSCICLAFKVVFLPIQYKKIIHNKAVGLWNI